MRIKTKRMSMEKSQTKVKTSTQRQLIWTLCTQHLHYKHISTKTQSHPIQTKCVVCEGQISSKNTKKSSSKTKKTKRNHNKPEQNQKIAKNRTKLYVSFYVDALRKWRSPRCHAHVSRAQSLARFLVLFGSVHELSFLIFWHLFAPRLCVCVFMWQHFNKFLVSGHLVLHVMRRAVVVVTKLNCFARIVPFDLSCVAPWLAISPIQPW